MTKMKKKKHCPLNRAIHNEFRQMHSNAQYKNNILLVLLYNIRAIMLNIFHNNVVLIWLKISLA
jgi:hypothetical protein